MKIWARELFLILKEIKKLRPKLRTAPKFPFIEAKVSDVVLTSNQLQPLAEYLLGDLLIVNNLMDSAKTSDLSEFQPKEEILCYKNNDWDNLSVENYTSLFKKSPVKRTKYKGLKRNINKNKKDLSRCE